MNTYFRPAPESKPAEPEWKRAVHVDDDGTIYVPATILGLLTEEFVYAEFKKAGEPLLCFRGHYYVTFDWLIKQLPHFQVPLAALRACMQQDPSLHVPSEQFGDEYFTWN